jgi:predicted porin
MKKSLLALAALSAFAGVASAQSSVTLFGIVDVAARTGKNGAAGDIYSLSTDGISSSRLGFRGVEDLGGGLRAGFWLEGGIQGDIGAQGGGNGGASAGTVMFNRRSTVSLLGNFGEVRLGRDYVPTFWNHTLFDPFGTNGVGSANNLITIAPTTAPFGGNFGNSAFAAQTFVRANNSIGYFLPELGGLYGQIMMTAGENQIPGNKYMGGRIGYAAGPFNFAAAYGQTEQSLNTSGDYKEWNVAGSWNFGFMNLMAQYSSLEEGPVNSITNWLVGATLPLGPGQFKASYSESSVDRAMSGVAFNDRKAKQFALGYQYDLSKRTAVYVNVAQIDNDAGLGFTTNVGGPAPTAAMLSAAGGGFKSTGYEFGLRHSF